MESRLTATQVQTVSLINQSDQRQEQSGLRRERTGRRPPPRAHAEIKSDEEPSDRQRNPEGGGRNLFDSFEVLGLGFDATEMDVKTTFRMLALCYHPDKNDPEITSMNLDQATAHFQLRTQFCKFCFRACTKLLNRYNSFYG